MRPRKFISEIGQFFDVMGSALAVSSAVRDRRPVRETDLINLGIDPQRFRGVKYR